MAAVKIEYAKDKIIVTIPYKEADIEAAPLSGTGVSKMITQTKGFVDVPDCPGEPRISVTLIKPLPKDQRPKK